MHALCVGWYALMIILWGLAMSCCDMALWCGSVVLWCCGVIRCHVVLCAVALWYAAVMYWCWGLLWSSAMVWHIVTQVASWPGLYRVCRSTGAMTKWHCGSLGCQDEVAI